MVKKSVAIVVFVLLILWITCLFIPSNSKSEEIEEPTRVYVTVKLLNGRARPSKKAMVEARFDKGDILEALQWSKKHHWIEVTGGETGTVWVYWEYVTERLEDSRWWNSSGVKVKIRKEPFGTVIGYLPKDGEIIVDQILLGWGHCNRGWVDLSYFEEEF